MRVNCQNPIAKLALRHRVLSDVARFAAAHAVFVYVSESWVCLVDSISGYSAVEDVFQVSFSVALVGRRRRLCAAVEAVRPDKRPELVSCQGERQAFDPRISYVIRIHVPEVRRSFFFAPNGVFRHGLSAKTAAAFGPAVGDVVVPRQRCSTTRTLAEIASNPVWIASVRCVYNRINFPDHGELAHGSSDK